MASGVLRGLLRSSSRAELTERENGSQPCPGSVTGPWRVCPEREG